MAGLVKYCKNCGKENAADRYFCEKCGEFLEKDSLKNPELTEIPQMKLYRILENLKYTPHSDIVWNDVVDQYTKKVERYKVLYDVEDLENPRKGTLYDKMNDFLDLCHKADFEIAFVGTVKTGKSTLINALLGKNYATTSVTPETAALTKFRSSPRDYINVTFYTKEEWEQLWNSRTSGADDFNKEYAELGAEFEKDNWVGHEPIHTELANSEIEEELEVWTSSKRLEHIFVKEVEVGISSLPADFPKQVVFVDTPGLGDPVQYRSDITNNYIRRANAVFVCVTARSINSTEVDTIASVFALSSHNKNKVHIIATQYDIMNDPMNDWQEQKEFVTKQLTGTAFFDEIEVARKNIMPSAAHIHNLCRDYYQLDFAGRKPLRTFATKLDMETSSDIIEANLANFIKFANINPIYDVIRDELIGNYKTLLYEDIEKHYLDVVLSLQRVSNDSKNELKKLIDTTQAGLKERKNKLEQQEKLKLDIEKYQKQLSGALEMVEKSTDETLNTIETFLKTKAQSIVNQKGKK